MGEGRRAQVDADGSTARCPLHQDGQSGGDAMTLLLCILCFAIGVNIGVIIQSKNGPDYDDHE
jgi:hypothetical protein